MNSPFRFITMIFNLCLVAIFIWVIVFAAKDMQATKELSLEEQQKKFQEMNVKDKNDKLANIVDTLSQETKTPSIQQSILHNLLGDYRDTFAKMLHLEKETGVNPGQPQKEENNKSGGFQTFVDH